MHFTFLASTQMALSSSLKDSQAAAEGTAASGVAGRAEGLNRGAHRVPGRQLASCGTRLTPATRQLPAPSSTEWSPQEEGPLGS